MGLILYWPTDHGVITQAYGQRPEYYRRFFYTGPDGRPIRLTGHEGLDLRAPSGSPIYACAAGVVKAVYTDTSQNYGIHVRLTHADGYETIYAHLQQPMVVTGQSIRASQRIGLADNTGNSSAAHLHLTLKKDGYIVDPTPYLEPFPRDYSPNHTLSGFHGPGMADYLLHNQIPGWCIEDFYSGDSLDVPFTGYDFTPHAQQGIRVIVCLSYRYPTGCSTRGSPNGQGLQPGVRGAYPPHEQYDEFIDWCTQTIANIPGVWGWIIGQYPNCPDRWSNDIPIMPADVSYLVNAVWQQAATQVRIAPPMIDPIRPIMPVSYPGFPEPPEYFRQVINNLSGMEFVPLHVQPTTSIVAPSDADQPFHQTLWHTVGPYLRFLYATRYRRLPVLLTGVRYGSDPAIAPLADGDPDQWLRDLYDQVARWNDTPGDQRIHGLCLDRRVDDPEPKSAVTTTSATN